MTTDKDTRRRDLYLVSVGFFGTQFIVFTSFWLALESISQTTALTPLFSLLVTVGLAWYLFERWYGPKVARI
jgi:hypothetical protein